MMQDMIENVDAVLEAALATQYRTLSLIERMEDLLTRFESMGLTEDEYGIPSEPKPRSPADEEQIRLFEEALGLTHEKE